MGSEVFRRQHPAAQFVLDDVMHQLDGPSLLAMPLDQAHGLPLPQVRQHREMAHAAAILEKLPLLLAHTDGDVAKRWRVFLLRFLPRDEGYLGALPDLGGMRLPL